MSERRKAACNACGRMVAVRFGVQGHGTHAGKARARHKCPHGQWCIAGRLSHGFVDAACASCRAALKGEQ
jgi:hypothetical protein